MKTPLLKPAWRAAAGFAFLCVLISILVHPFGTPKQLDDHQPPAADLRPTAEVGAILKRACVDCHSNRTVWPWYSYVAPVSWLVERDVRRGRDHLNFSTWDGYSVDQREKLLAEIASEVKNREMPLPQYTLVHRHAALSEADLDIVYNWARAERRRMKALHPPAPPADNSHVGKKLLRMGIFTGLR